MAQYDIALRHVTRRHAEDLARALLPPGLSLEVVGWLDTQVTTLERRLDKALDVRVAGERRALHVEIAVDLPLGDFYRFYTYHAHLVMALHGEVAQAPPAPKPEPTADTKDEAKASRTHLRAPVPVHSVVILLRGRKDPWPEEAAFATGWPEMAFCGAHLRVEAVYQRTVAELRARGGLLWLVFTPLATDASAAAMREVLAELRERVPQLDDRGDLFTALLVMAALDPWGHNLQEELKAMMQADDYEVFKLSPTLREVIEEGEQRGEQRGELKGKEELLSEAFADQLGRDATADEQAALAKRAKELGARQALRALLKLHGDALVAWLLGDGHLPDRAG
jgi:hypothetical protein